MPMKLEGSFADFESDENKSKTRKEKTSIKSRTPVLDNFSRDLIKYAEEGKLDPVVGRGDEINRIAQILSRRKKNNPVLIGEPGCGKTALVEGLAIKINEGRCPRNLLDKRIIALDLTSIVAGTKYRGQFEERMKAIIDELKDNPNIIIFIDEIHTVVGTGNASGSLDAANIFKPALARGEVQCIGATTINEYRENIEKDGALERRFQKVVVEPTTMEETLQILNNIKEKYEDHHKVKFTEESLSTCVMLAERYITNREFPDKAIDIMDEVGAKVQVDIEYPKEIEDLRSKLSDLKLEKVEVVKSQKYEKAAELRDEEKNVVRELEDRKLEWEIEMESSRIDITEKDIYDVVSQITKIPLSKLDADETKSLLTLEKSLKKLVIGQDEAIQKIARAIRRNRVGIREVKKPIGSFMFLGSTGVGKTHLAKAIAKEVFGSEDALIRLDMSEYKEKFNSTRLIGSPPGYVGYNEGGQLTEAVRKKPYSVILLDEIEKAHSDIYDLLLQIFDDGHITDSLGRKINFKNTLLIMTSNVGAKQVSEFNSPLGFSTKESESRLEEKREAIIKKALKNTFRPEFLNRIDQTVVFKPLEKSTVSKIIKLEIKSLQDRLVEQNYDISFDDSITKFILNEGYDEKFGARPIKRAIQNKIEDFISENILKGDILENMKYKISVTKENEIVINTI
jgi:ATP-dependent Clp protease ATP-binding subunit ClpC